MTDIERKKITEFQQDISNANTGTERGLRMLDDSIAETGLGRSIVVDKDGRIIGGNKTQERAVDSGFEDAIIVHTTGDKLVVVQRDDLDLSDPDPNNPARKLAYYDNRVAQLDLNWNPEQLLADTESGLNLDSMFRRDEIDVLFKTITTPMTLNPGNATTQQRVSGGESVATDGTPRTQIEPVTASHVRMVQLFLRSDNVDEFNDLTMQLAQLYGTQNLTDTIFEAIRREANNS